MTQDLSQNLKTPKTSEKCTRFAVVLSLFLERYSWINESIWKPSKDIVVVNVLNLNEKAISNFLKKGSTSFYLTTLHLPSPQHKKNKIPDQKEPVRTFQIAPVTPSSRRNNFQATFFPNLWSDSRSPLNSQTAAGYLYVKSCKNGEGASIKHVVQHVVTCSKRFRALPENNPSALNLPCALMARTPSTPRRHKILRFAKAGDFPAALGRDSKEHESNVTVKRAVGRPAGRYAPGTSCEEK